MTAQCTAPEAAEARHAAARQENAVRSAISADFPDWHIWRSSGHRWWATRRGNARCSRRSDPRWSMTIDGDTPEELRQALVLQAGFS